MGNPEQPLLARVPEVYLHKQHYSHRFEQNERVKGAEIRGFEQE